MGKGRKALPFLPVLTGSNAKKLERRKGGGEGERRTDFIVCPHKMAATFSKGLRLSGGVFLLDSEEVTNKRLAACQAGLKQFQLLDLYTFRKEEVYYFPQQGQWNRM